MTRTLEIALEKESARLRFDRMVEFLLHGGASSKKREENGVPKNNNSQFFKIKIEKNYFTSITVLS